MTFQRFQWLRGAANVRMLSAAEVAELFDAMEALDRERRVAVEIASCHYNDGPCGTCESACDKIDPAWRGGPWSDGIAKDLG